MAKKVYFGKILTIYTLRDEDEVARTSFVSRFVMVMRWW